MAIFMHVACDHATSWRCLVKVVATECINTVLLFVYLLLLVAAMTGIVYVMWVLIKSMYGDALDLYIRRAGKWARSRRGPKPKTRASSRVAKLRDLEDEVSQPEVVHEALHHRDQDKDQDQDQEQEQEYDDAE